LMKVWTGTRRRRSLISASGSRFTKKPREAVRLCIHTHASTQQPRQGRREPIHCRVELCAHCLPSSGKDSPAADQTRLRSRKMRWVDPDRVVTTVTGVGYITHLSQQLTQLVLAAEQVAQHRVGLRDQPAARKERHKKQPIS
jgi:hypothetical protein